MNILALNAGSSSLKYKMFAMPDEAVLAEGNLEHSGDGGMRTLTGTVIEKCLPFGIDAMGHRLVHGGPYFVQPTRIDPAVLETLRSLQQLDPVHNPAEMTVIEEGLRRVPHAPAVAIFDTAFHRTMPSIAALYALPSEMVARQGLRHYGFHGVSYRYVSEHLLQYLGWEAMGKRLIICHLGSGASICAIRDGVSIDTSMGMTPLSGVIMGTRCGDIDPGLLLYLLRTQKITVAELDDLLNHQSGLKGISGISGDVRQLEKSAAEGNAPAELALAAFVYSVRKYIGAYVAVMDGVDAIAFTGGIGEHSISLRQRICEEMHYLGITLDEERNGNTVPHSSALLSADDSKVPICLIPTDEERQVVRETYQYCTGTS